MGRLDGKVAIITGGARGQGASHARRFVQEGAKVVFTDVLVDEGNALAGELGENAKFIKHDVTSSEEWQKVVAEAEAAFGPVNILVNNAGIAISQDIEQMTEETYQKVIDVNQKGVFLGMKYVLPSMRKAGGGSIVNISSISGILGIGGAAYVASKFAVRGMTKTAALEFAKYNIRVNSIHPGIIWTPMVQQADTKDLVNELAKAIPMGRVAQPEEVTNLLLFLVSDENSYSTGSEFVIDGGYIIQ